MRSALVNPPATGAAWAAVPGQRTGLSLLSLELATNHAEADLEGRPAVVRASDPAAYAVRALGLAGDDPAGAGDAAAADAAGTTGDTGDATAYPWQVYAAVGLGALLVVAAGAFAVAQGD